MTLEQLFNKLIAGRTAEEFTQALEAVGDSPEIDIQKQFGPLKLRWEPFGDRMSNISSIGLGTKPGRSLTERLTNAMDAVLEERARKAATFPDSSRIAAQQWFGRPITGPEDGLFQWKFEGTKADRFVNVVMLPSGMETAPTVDVMDEGVGIAPCDFRSTILSLQAGNKLTKKYLIGAFGQGGAATLSFCQYALIVSRTQDNPSTVGFTVIRVMRLSDNYKDDAYAYLAVLDTDGKPTVPHVTRGEPLALYASAGKVKNPPVLTYGTLVRHVQYKLPSLTGSLSPSPNNLYQYLHTSMFDPLLPFRVIDLRDEDRARDERITGSRNRLMRLVAQQKDNDEQDGRVEIRHHRPMEYFSLQPGEAATTGIEYWVVNHFRKAKKGGKDELILRSNSIESFVDPAHPIVGTLNGQNQGERTARIFKDLGLTMTARHIVVHVDASNATPRLRRELFSTSREGFKDGDVLTALERILHDMLDEDEDLKKIEQELTDRLTKRDTEETNKEVQDQITKLLREAGFEVKADGQAPKEGEGDLMMQKMKARQRVIKPKPPLPTLPYPNVTKFKIVAPQPQMDVSIGDYEVVLVETDADAEFDKRGMVAVRVEPKILEEFGKSPLKGGRVRWRFRPTTDAKAGQTGKIIATITRPDGTQLSDETVFQVLPALEVPAKMDKGQVPPFKIIPVSPEQEEKWNALWPHLGEEVGPDKQAQVAYKQLKVSGETHVYYSTIFAPYRETLDMLKSRGGNLAQFFDNAYQVWIGYHAILQENARKDSSVEIDPDKLDTVLEEDRVRVARLQAKQALQTAKLREELVKALAAA
jgi:hypothetical protein